MAGRRASRVATVVGAVLAATGGLALAHGFGGHGGGIGAEGHLLMLAKVAGVDHSQIRTAFRGDTALKSDFENLRNAHQALIACLVSGSGACDSQISALANAQQALTTEKYKVWEGVFKGAPNSSKATAFLGQMQQLAQQRRAILQQALGNPSSGAETPETPPAPPVE